MTKKVIATGLWAGALALAMVLPVLDRSATAQSSSAAVAERIAAGRLGYRVHCASCHGESGRGDGPMVKVLKIRPTDLTRLALSHQGRFPREEVYNAIDGRREVTGHGPTSMPVWGATFQDRGQDRPQEREVREKILDLLTYLESIQAAH